MKRVKGVTVTPHYCPIQDKDGAWYKQFQIIVMGLDSIEVRASFEPEPPHPSLASTPRTMLPHGPDSFRPGLRRPRPWALGKPSCVARHAAQARRWLNAMACSLVEFETTASGERKPDLSCVRPPNPTSCGRPTARSQRPARVVRARHAAAAAHSVPPPAQDGDSDGRWWHRGLRRPRAHDLPLHLRLLRVHARPLPATAGARRMPHAACRVPHAACRVPHAACRVPHPREPCAVRRAP